MSRAGRGLPLTVGLLAVLVVMNMLPLFWGVLTSFKRDADILAYPPVLLFAPTLDHYARIFQEGFGRNLLTTLQNTVIAVSLSLLVGIPAAYGFDRARFPMRRLLYMTVVACIPLSLGASALIIPAYLWFVRLGLTDTPFILPLVYAGYQAPIVIWIMKNAFESIPTELDEAATIDGCGHFGILCRVLLPLVRPGIGAAASLAFVGCWNEFLAGAVMVDAIALKPVQPAIYAFVGFFGRDWGPLTAAATITILPVILAFALFGKMIISGLTGGAVKG